MALEKLLASVQHNNSERLAESLLKHIDCVLLLSDNHLTDLLSGDVEPLSESPSDRPQQDGEPMSAAADCSADAIAHAAASLLHRNGQSEARILLLLPGYEVLVTPVDLPGVAAGALRAALQLQASALLPAYDQPLSLALNRHAPHVAIWMPTERIEALYHAFSQLELLLTAIAPTPVLALLSEQASSAQRVEVQEGVESDVLHLDDQKITQWWQVTQSDLQAPEFAAQWQTLIADTPPGVIANNNAWLNMTRHMTAASIVTTIRDYVFIPQGAMAARFRLGKGKRRSLILGAAAAVVLALSVPLLVQTVQRSMLERELEQLRVAAAPVREDQAAVREFEDQWGALTEYPRQQLSNILLALQNDIAPGTLTAIEVDAGYISLEGDSDDPQNLLEQLEQNTLFTEVDFARATNNTRYFIDLRLATVNFPAYQEWYFPESR